MKRILLSVLLIGFVVLIGIGIYPYIKSDSKTDIKSEVSSRVYKPASANPAQQDKNNPNRYYFDVPANVMWADTGIMVGGRKFHIQENPGSYWVWDSDSSHNATAKGAGWKHDGTIVGNAPLAALVGTVFGGTTYFLVGESFQSAVQPKTAGTLRLSCNDIPGGFVDNQGTISVVIDLE